MRAALVRLACSQRSLNSQLCPQRCPPRFAISTSQLFHTAPTIHAPRVPTFTTTESMDFVTLTDPDMKKNLVKDGTLNAPLPKEYNLSLDEFIPLATDVVALVTQQAAQGKWNEIDSLLKPDCAEKLKAEVEKMDPEQRKLIMLDPDDVLMKFVSNTGDCSGGNNLNLVTFSFAGWCQISEVMGHFLTHLKEQKKVNMSNEEFAEISKLVELQTDVNIQEIFDSSEVVIGNYRLIRDHDGDNFSLAEVGQIAMDDPRIHPDSRATVRALMMMSIRTDQPFMESFKMATKTHYLSKILGFGLVLNVMFVVGYYLFAK